MFISNFFFIYIFKKKINNIKNINFSILFFLKNIGNICTCIRTCTMFNVCSIVNIKLKFKINYFLENVFFVNNIEKIFYFLKKKNIFLSFSIKSNINIKKIFLKKKFIIILGNEKKGLKKKFLKKSDIILKINNYCKKSFNVNVVNGIILFYLKNEL